MAMGVVVMPMIQARPAGCCSLASPTPPARRPPHQCGLGLGRYAVGGVINPDHYLVAYPAAGRVLAQTIPPKEVMLVAGPRRRRPEVPVPPELVNAPCLDQAQIDQLWLGRHLEAHFDRPQTWSGPWMKPGPSGSSRAGRCNSAPQSPGALGPDLKDYTVLIDHGTVGLPGRWGRGAGVLCARMANLNETSPRQCPGWPATPPPKYVTVNAPDRGHPDRAGQPHRPHNGLLAREFQVPTILNTGNATQILGSGQVVPWTPIITTSMTA